MAGERWGGIQVWKAPATAENGAGEGTLIERMVLQRRNDANAPSARSFFVINWGSSTSSAFTFSIGIEGHIWWQGSEYVMWRAGRRECSICYMAYVQGRGQKNRGLVRC